MDETQREIARQIFLELENHNAGWDGLMVNAYWTKKIKTKFGVADIETRELGVNVPILER